MALKLLKRDISSSGAINCQLKIMRNKKKPFEEIETTFGHMRVYKDSETKPSDSNYIDEVYFDKLVNKNTDQEKKSDQSEVQSQSSASELFNDLNFFDQQLVKKEAEMSSLNVTKKDMESLEDLNFIDKQLVGSNQLDNHSNDSSIGSLREFREKQPKAKTKSEIPIIQSSNLKEDDPSTKKLFKKSASNDSKTQSQHKILSSEVPDWKFLTINEAADILSKHICYYDEEQGILAIDKPYGLPSMGGSGVNLSVTKLIPIIQEKKNIKHNLFMCNRLDEFTTGVMLFALNKETATKIREFYNQKKVLKQYLAITKHIPEKRDGEIDIPLIRRRVNGIVKTYLSPDYNEETKVMLQRPNSDNSERKNAITKYRVLDANDNKCALLELQPTTGFQHQIRAHLAFGLGCPILGDHKYSHHVKLAPQKLPDEMLRCLKIPQSKVRHVPMHLHAYKVILSEFHQNKNVFISAKLPFHFLQNLKRLKLKF